MSDPAETAELRRLAVELARLGGTVAADGWHRDTASGVTRSAMTAATKTSATDIVTLHDRAAEDAMVTVLSDRRPNDAVLGEEGTAHPGTSGRSWFLDPIDGTTNFLYGLPAWSTSVAVGDADGMLAGAVYVPSTGDLFSAARGGGATRNGVPIHASGETDLALALVATGFAYDPARRTAQARRFTGMAAAIRDLRRGGSAAIDLCYAAGGLVDAYFEDGLNSWDIAAGELIAREAGCRTGDFAGGPPTPAQVLAAPPALFEQLSTLLRAGA